METMNARRLSAKVAHDYSTSSIERKAGSSRPRSCCFVCF